MQVKTFTTDQANQIKNTPLCPRLAKVMHGINQTRPLIEFYFLNKKVVGRSDTGEYTYHITEVEAWQQGFRLGSIDSQVLRETKKGTERWFGVESPYIRKSRGYNRNQLVSKEPEKTIKNAIDNLIKPTLEAAAGGVIKEVTGAISRMMYRVRSQLLSSFDLRYAGDDLTMYLIEHIMGMNPELPSKYKVIPASANEKHAAYATAKNVEGYAAGHGYAMEILPNETWLVTHVSEPQHATVYQAISDMPQFMQEKVTMLKLLGDGEPALDIGVRFGEASDGSPDRRRVFFVVEGETKIQ